jgi:tRNA G10  N-methylase Trm11
MRLHNNGENFDVDPTYSTGRFWQGLTPPALKFDIVPQAEGVVQASADSLPLESESVGSIMFDPPFVIRESGKSHTGKIANRFSAFRTIKDLWTFYDCALEEFWRILRWGGIVAFKCQDTITGGEQYMSHYEIMKKAEALGFHCKDVLILHNPQVLFSPNMAKQQHARKTHSYYLVFEKRKKGLPEWRTLRNSTIRNLSPATNLELR